MLEATKVIREDARDAFIQLLEFSIEETEKSGEDVIDPKTAEAAVVLGEAEFTNQTIKGFKAFINSEEEFDVRFLHNVVRRFNAPYYKRALKMETDREVRENIARRERLDRLHEALEKLSDEKLQRLVAEGTLAIDTVQP